MPTDYDCLGKKILFNCKNVFKFIRDYFTIL